MAFPFYQLDYHVPIVGSLTGALLAPLVSAVPLPVDQIEQLGAFVSVDTTVVGADVDRTVTVEVDCPIPASLAPVLDPDGGIEAVTVTGTGVGYVRPPVILANEPATDFLNARTRGVSLQAYLQIVTLEPGGSITEISPGAGYSAATIVGAIGGLPPGQGSMTQSDPDGADDWLGTLGFGTREKDPPANSALNTEACVNFVTVTAQGENYAASTQVLFLGAEPSPGGRPPVAFPVIVGGRITRVQMVDPGAGYVAPLTVTFFDPTGAGHGAVGSVSMMRGRPAQLLASVAEGEVTGVTVVDPGDGYVSVPQIVIFDPTGAGSGAVYTVDAVPNVAIPLMGVSRVDVLNPGKGYAPTVALSPFTLFEAAYIVSLASGDFTEPGRAWRNLLRTAIQNLVATQVTENIS